MVVLSLIKTKRDLIYIDTNVILARMDPKHKDYKVALNFLKEIKQKGTGVVSINTIFELIWVLIYIDKSAFIPAILNRVFKSNLQIVTITTEILHQFKNRFEPIYNVKDFLHSIIMDAYDIETIATFNPGPFKVFGKKLYVF